MRRLALLLILAGVILAIATENAIHYTRGQSSPPAATSRKAVTRAETARPFEPATAESKPAFNPETVEVQPHDAFGDMVRQAIISSQAIPTVVDGRSQGECVRTVSLLQFIIDDYKRRTGDHPDGPSWQSLTYSVIGYDRAVHQSVASGTGAFVVQGQRPASYSMAITDAPDAIQHALIQAVLMDKDGGIIFAQWDLEWTPNGWHSLASVTPTLASKPTAPSLVK